VCIDPRTALEQFVTLYRVALWTRRTVGVTEVYAATLQRDGSWRRVASAQDNATSAAAEPVTLRRGRASGVACVAVADNACDGASLRSLRPVVRDVDTESRFVRTVETVLKSPVALHGATDLPACRTTAISWYWTLSAPTLLNGRELICVTGNQLSATAPLIVECKTIFIKAKFHYAIWFEAGRRPAAS